MNMKPIFEGLIIDEYDQPVSVTYVGDESFYIVNDAGFLRHVPSRNVDEQVLTQMIEQIKGHEDLITDQTAKMLGQEDIFSRAIIQNQLKNIDKQIDDLFKVGIPESGRQYLGMMGFKVVINIHGEVVKVDQPTAIQEPDE